MLKSFKNSVLNSRMARNSTWMFIGQFLRTALQAGYFFLIARSLGVSEYGAFIAITSLVAILAPFSTLGAGNIIILKVARDPSKFSESWGEALFLALTTGAVLAVVIIAIARFALPSGIARTTILLVALSDLLGPRISDIAAYAFGAFEQFHWNAVLQIFSTGCRVVAAGAMVATISHPTASQWVWFYVASSIVMSAVSVTAVTVKLGMPSFRYPDLWKDMKEGFYFSLSTCSQTVYNDIDKTMLSRLSTLTATGIYGAAYRIVDVSCAPLRSILGAAYPSFFRNGAAGVDATYRLAVRLLRKAGLFAIAATLGMFLFAPVIPHLLGAGYKESVDALRWLALLPILKCVHFFFGDALSGAGHQRLRASMQVLVAVFNVLVNLWIIPAYSWRGAAWSSLASDGLLAGLLLCSILILRRSEIELLRKQAVVVAD
jgi:O-antigen/teichoic acid export membrane protein